MIDIKIPTDCFYKNLDKACDIVKELAARSDMHCIRLEFVKDTYTRFSPDMFWISAFEDGDLEHGKEESTTNTEE